MPLEPVKVTTAEGTPAQTVVVPLIVAAGKALMVTVFTLLIPWQPKLFIAETRTVPAPVADHITVIVAELPDIVLVPVPLNTVQV